MAATSDIIRPSAARASIAMMPWPGAGTHVGIGSAAEIRARWLESNEAWRTRGRARRIRPRRASGGAYQDSRGSEGTGAPGNSRVSCADPSERCSCRCAGCSPSRAASSIERHARQAHPPRLRTRRCRRVTRRRPARSSRGAAPRRWRVLRAGSTGMSLLLWTARSTSPASSASSISLTKSRLPPICVERGFRQPDRRRCLITTISHSTPGFARSSAATALA